MDDTGKRGWFAAYRRFWAEVGERRLGLFALAVVAAVVGVWRWLDGRRPDPPGEPRPVTPADLARHAAAR